MVFADLKIIVDLIRDGVSSYRGFKTRETREQLIVDILKTYFLLLDCVDEGERLISAAGPNPIETIKAMGQEKAAAILEDWDLALRKQNVRLQLLQNYIFGQDHLAVIDPALQKQIEKVVGDKWQTGMNLYKIGAHLFFSSMFGTSKTNEERAENILIFAGVDENTLDMTKIQNDITKLRDSLDQYRVVLTRFLSDEEVLTLSNRARAETRLEEEDAPSN